MDFETWAAFVAASAVLLAVPGPNVALVVACALAHGPRSAWPLAAGIVAADLVLMTAALLGLGALLAVSPSLLGLLQVAGAAYVAWLGVATWRAAGGPADPGAVAAPGLALARRACLASLLNPLSVGFFAAYLPQFLDPARPLAAQGAVLAATFLALVAANVLALAALAGRAGRRLAAPGGAAAGRAGGAVLVAVSAALLAGAA